MAIGSKKGSSNTANIRSAVYPEMGTFKGRGKKEPRSSHMTWGSGKRGSSR